ncbi:MAG: hypothetical protein ACOH2L_11560, partial [Devosia sp.]
ASQGIAIAHRVLSQALRRVDKVFTFSVAIIVALENWQIFFVTQQQIATSQSSFQTENVRYTGALTGCYTLSERRVAEDDALPIYACRQVRLTTVLGRALGDPVLLVDRQIHRGG